MCLHEVDKETKEITEGWKIFEIRNKKLEGVFRKIPFETNKWIRDNKNYNIKTFNTNEDIYQTGFHFFFNKKDAEECTVSSLPSHEVYKVKVRNVVATGKQDMYYNEYTKIVPTAIGVAREIFIEEK